MTSTIGTSLMPNECWIPECVCACMFVPPPPLLPYCVRGFSLWRCKVVSHHDFVIGKQASLVILRGSTKTMSDTFGGNLVVTRLWEEGGGNLVVARLWGGGVTFLSFVGDGRGVRYVCCVYWRKSPGSTYWTRAPKIFQRDGILLL